MGKRFLSIACTVKLIKYSVNVSVCRALGIPCRSVTNYVSAHDTNASLTIDKYFDKEGNEIKGGPDGRCYDSCWNFHVWNDVWMSRPDLPNGYGGWQIMDATPQEESDSKYMCNFKKKEVIYVYLENTCLFFRAM